MPQKSSIIKCVQCNHTESPMWRLCENGQICNSCYEENKKQLLNELEPETPDVPGNENTNCKKRNQESEAQSINLFIS